MHQLDLIMTLTACLTAALVGGFLAHKTRLSPIVGYLLSGMIVGPFTPGFVADRGLAEQLSEVGVILLMFGVGLEFHLKELLAVRRVAIPGAVGQSLAAALGTMVFLHLFGESWTAGLVFGLCLSVASTVVLIRVLSDQRALHSPAGHISVGWLVVEDLFTVLVLVLLPAIFGKQSDVSPNLGMTVGIALLKVTALVVGVFIIGGRVVPWLMHRAARTRSRELFTLTVLVIALGIAVGSAQLFGVSMALGAFLAGMIVGQSEFSHRAAIDALPMRDAFAVLFFVTVGMLMNPRDLMASPWLLLSTLFVILIIKPVAAFVIVRWLGSPPRTALSVSAALAQIGEFSFMLGDLGRKLEILTTAQTNVLGAAAIVSITLNPFLFKSVKPLETWATRKPWLWKWLTARVPAPAGAAGAEGATSSSAKHRDAAHRAVIIGYGPVGRTVTRLLRENEIEPTIVEMNVDTVRRLVAEGIPAVYGDATHRETLKNAGVPEAGTVILTASNTADSPETIRVARDLNAKVRILARAGYVKEIAALRSAGADAVFSSESEVGFAMIEALLRGLGATDEQLDRERDRVYAELGAVRGPNDAVIDALNNESRQARDARNAEIAAARAKQTTDS